MINSVYLREVLKREYMRLSLLRLCTPLQLRRVSGTESLLKSELE